MNHPRTLRCSGVALKRRYKLGWHGTSISRIGLVVGVGVGGWDGGWVGG